MTVGDLLRRMSGEEFAQWAAYYRIEPWGETRADLRNGVVASLLYNINRTKDAPPLSPADFLLFEKKPDAAQSETNLRDRFRALFPGNTKHPDSEG